MLVTGAGNMKIKNWNELNKYLELMMDNGNMWKFDDMDEDWFINNIEIKNDALSRAEYIDFTNLKLFISDERDAETATWEKMFRQICDDDDIEGLLYSINVSEMRFYVLYNSEKNLFELDDEIIKEELEFLEENSNQEFDPNEIF